MTDNAETGNAAPLLVLDSDSLEKYIPASLAVASAVCFVDPSKFPSVLFAFLFLGFLFRDSLLGFVTQPLLRHVSESTTQVVEEAFRDEDRFDRLLSAGTNALQRSAKPLRKTLKEAIVESMQDEELESILLKTTTRAIVKATQDESLLEAFSTVTKQSMLAILRDQRFLKDSTRLLVDSLLAAVKDEELTEALLAVGTGAVSAALQDEKFVAIFRTVMKDVLSDGSMYRAGAAGLVGAFLPKGSQRGKKDSVRSTSTPDHSGEIG